MGSEQAIKPNEASHAREKVYSYLQEVMDIKTKNIDIKFHFDKITFKSMFQPLVFKIDEIQQSLRDNKSNPDLHSILQAQYHTAVKNVRDYHRMHLLAMSEYFEEAKLTRAEVFVGEHHLCSLDLMRLKQRKEAKESEQQEP
ncbi:MAG TPA: hypothetical protein VL125_12420 [Pelobium sp.]|nr:hypothetical protein [Pelobium sp.]